MVQLRSRYRKLIVKMGDDQVRPVSAVARPEIRNKIIRVRDFSLAFEPAEDAAEVWQLYIALLRALDRCRGDLAAVPRPGEDLLDLRARCEETRNWLLAGRGREDLASLATVLGMIPENSNLRREMGAVIQRYGQVLDTLRSAERPLAVRCQDVVEWVREVPGGLWLRLQAAGVRRPGEGDIRFHRQESPYRLTAKEARPPHDLGDIPFAA